MLSSLWQKGTLTVSPAVESHLKNSLCNGYCIVTVLKYSTPLAVKASAISTVVATQARGCPLPIGLPMVTISGQKPSPCSWNAQKWLPTRPKPVCTSSATNTPPAERTYLWEMHHVNTHVQKSRIRKGVSTHSATFVEYPWGKMICPPTLGNDSAKKAEICIEHFVNK